MRRAVIVEEECAPTPVGYWILAAQPSWVFLCI